MAFTHNIIFLFSAIFLLFHIFITTAQTTSSGDGDGIEVLIDVEHNRATQELGMFAVEKQNLRNSVPEISFIEVVGAKRWPVNDGFMYFLTIDSKTKINDVEVEGSFYAYVNVQGDDRTFKSGGFQATRG